MVTTTFLDPATSLGYLDTVSDMVVGTLGSLVAGLLMPMLASAPRSGRATGGRGGAPAPARRLRCRAGVSRP